MLTRTLSAAMLALAAACSRYEWKNEVDIPDLCDSVRQAPHVVSRRAGLTTDSLGARLRGRVTRRVHGEPVIGARITWPG